MHTHPSGGDRGPLDPDEGSDAFESDPYDDSLLEALELDESEYEDPEPRMPRPRVSPVDVAFRTDEVPTDSLRAFESEEPEDGFLYDEDDPAPMDRPSLPPPAFNFDDPLPPPPVFDEEAPVVEPVSGEVSGEQQFQRWYPLLDRSPVFQGSESAQVLTANADSPDNLELSIEISADYEFHSVSTDENAEVNVLVTLHPSGASLVDPADGPVSHVVLALDLSASMNHPDKYPVLTDALAGMLYELQRPGQGDVLLSVVLFAYGSETLIRDTPASEIDPRELLRQIDASPLRFGRYTDIVGALSRCGRIAYDHRKRDKLTPIRVYVMTDGKPQDTEKAHQVMQTMRKMPIDVHGLAFGADADVRILKELVAGGRGGTVKHVRAETIGEAFGRIAEVAQRVVALRSLVDFELCPGVVGGAAYRFRPGRHSFGTAAFVAGRDFNTDLGTLESGRGYSLLFQLLVPRTMQSETEIGHLTLRVPGFGGPRTFETTLSIARHAGGEPVVPNGMVVEAKEILSALNDESDPRAALRALKTRRKLYADERRDPHVIALLDKAIAEMESRGSLEALSSSEQAALLAHTCTVGNFAEAPAPRSREFTL